MDQWMNINIEIRNVETTAPPYYLKALMQHIKETIEWELNNAPEKVIESYENITIEGEIVKVGA